MPLSRYQHMGEIGTDVRYKKEEETLMKSHARLMSLMLMLSFSCGYAAAESDVPSATDDNNGAKGARPVQVFILMGQSNMLGFGKISGDDDGSLEYAVKHKKLYPYLKDESQPLEWRERHDVRNVHVQGSGLADGKILKNEWLSVTGRSIGPELGIGCCLGDFIDDASVLLLKSCIGNRALGWDLLPPGSEGFEFTDKQGQTWVHPGYKGSPQRWLKGTVPEPIQWYAGMQYDGDVQRAKEVLSNFATYMPHAPSRLGESPFEVAGFFWWQGDRDSRSEALSSRYEQNLVHLIRTLRKEFHSPDAKFVCASLGQTQKGDATGGGKILNAMLAVDGSSGKYPEFDGNVASIYSYPLSKGGSSGSHYNKHAETYMNVGEAMGQAMVRLLQSSATDEKNNVQNTSTVN